MHAEYPESGFVIVGKDEGQLKESQLISSEEIHPKH